MAKVKADTHRRSRSQGQNVWSQGILSIVITKVKVFKKQVTHHSQGQRV
jgi:hypothetical protein